MDTSNKKRKVNPILQRCLESITPEEREKTDFYMTLLAEWKSCYSDILDAAKKEGLDIDENNKDSFIVISEYFYLKGVLDAYNKLKNEKE